MVKVLWLIFILSATGAAYVLFVRPWLHALEAVDPYLDRADNFWIALWQKVRPWWLEALGLLSIVGAEIPDLLTQASLIDFSAFLEYETAKRITQGLALAGIVIRAVYGRRAAEREGGL